MRFKISGSTYYGLWEPKEQTTIPVYVSEVTEDRIRVHLEDGKKDIGRPYADLLIARGSQDILKHPNFRTDKKFLRMSQWLEEEDLKNSPVAVSKLIQQVLTPDLLTKEWRGKLTEKDHNTRGHCYAASEAAYYLLGGKEAGWKPCVASLTDGTTHWWITDGDIICDPTEEQFLVKGEVLPYAFGKGCGFLTKKPSKRAQTILDRLAQD